MPQMRWGNDLSPQERIAILEKQFARVEGLETLTNRPEWLTFLELLGILRSGQDGLVMSVNTKNVDYHRGRCAQIDELVAIVANTISSKDKLLDRLCREKMRLKGWQDQPPRSMEPHDGGTEADGSRSAGVP